MRRAFLAVGIAAALGALWWTRRAEAGELASPGSASGPGALGILQSFDDYVKATNTMTPEEVESNLGAFLMMIRTAEGTAGAEGYRTLFGGELFDGYADHPRRAVTATLKGKTITSTAAGAYQILARTWDDVRGPAGLADFTPESQDAAALYLIKRRGALDDVRQGRFDAAVRKCASEWASLPGSPYGQPTISLDRARTLFADAGGTFA